MRHQITHTEVSGVTLELCRNVNRRLQVKGHGAYVSSHETMGIITEEYDEAKDAVRANDHQHLRAELIDIAVGCLIGIISIDAGLEF